MLIEQIYPGREDYLDHFYNVLPALADPRYIMVTGKKLFVIYHPYDIPSCLEFTDHWRNLAEKEGLPGPFFVGVGKQAHMAAGHGLDGFVRSVPVPQRNTQLFSPVGITRHGRGEMDICCKMPSRNISKRCLRRHF